ncbi:MAG: AraC family transcriptional regulator [Bacteroidales bacterium]|nr:AraC family transcriptional regulator [Bacteroidales bacterium]MBN2819546.1 AraC family transcriptional regulator [Bacteroidales bacterium]
MSFNLASPSNILSPYIKQYWSIDSCIHQKNVHTQRIVPNGLMELIFYLEDKPESSDKNKSISDRSLITGQQRSFYDLKITGKMSLFSVIFQPAGLSVFFDIPSDQFFDLNIPLRHILGKQVDELEAKLFEANSFSGKIKVIENFLLHRLHKAQKKFQLERINSSIEIINLKRGNVKIDELASDACLCRKQFERIFSEYIGTSPKQFLKIVRFQNAISKKAKKKNLNLTELTYACGYYDQSHMTNDFQKLSGLSPKLYFASCDAFSDYFQ